MEFNIQDYLKKIEDIRKEKLLSKVDIYREIGVDYQTFTRLNKGLNEASLKTKRKIRDYVDRHYGK